MQCVGDTQEERFDSLAQRGPELGTRLPVQQLVKEVAGRAMKQEAKCGKVSRSGERVVPAASGASVLLALWPRTY